MLPKKKLWTPLIPLISIDASNYLHLTSLFYVIVVVIDEVKSSSEHLLVQRQQ